jgi:hypothetical protein
VGVGSVGTRCAIVLLLGGAEGDDPLFIRPRRKTLRFSDRDIRRVPCLE